MLSFLRRYLARRRLRPVVSQLPRRLAMLFACTDYCTVGQARRAISDLRLKKSIETYAYAAVCRFPDVEGAGIVMSADDYQRLRAELTDLFHIARPNFTIRDLLSTPHSGHHPAQENVYAASGPD
jgi:hypothetical protein